MPEEVSARHRDDARGPRDAETFNILRGRESVSGLVSRLAADPPHPWIGEAAALAAKRLHIGIDE